MAPHWIINRKQRRPRPAEERPVLQLPIACPEARDLVKEDGEEQEEKVERGIAVIDFFV